MKTIYGAALMSAGILSSLPVMAADSDEKVIVVVSLTTENFREWKTNFDAAAAIREKAGMKVLHICTQDDNEKNVVVIEEAANMQVAKDFADLLKKRTRPGAPVPEIKMYRQH